MQISSYFHIVGVLFLPLWVGLGNAASTPCETSNGCGDDTSLLQIGFGEEQGKFGQLADGTGMGVEEGRSSMLQYGDRMLRLMTKKYGNASSNINGSDKELLRAIIGLINETMYASLAGDHTEDQTEIDAARNVVVKCNDDLSTSLAGNISTKNISTQAAREKHETCRNGLVGGSNLLQVVKSASSEQRNSQLSHTSEAGSCEIAQEKCEALNQTIFDINDPPTPPNFPDVSGRTLEAVTDFFAAPNPYVIWFYDNNLTFSQKKTDCDDATEECETNTQTCNNDQHAFELQYTVFKLEYDQTCRAYVECFSPESIKYGQVKKEVEASQANRKAAYEAGEIIIHKIECLLGDHSCELGDIDSTRYDLTFTSLPEEETCNAASEVEHSKCDQEFIAAEYGDIDDVIPGLGCGGP